MWLGGLYCSKRGHPWLIGVAQLTQANGGVASRDAIDITTEWSGAKQCTLLADTRYDRHEFVGLPRQLSALARAAQKLE